MPLAEEKPTAAVCPLCGEANLCALAAGDKSECWCAGRTFPRALLERVPDAQRQRSCICRRCLERFEASTTGER